ncbi:acetylxylan esterase [Pseudonocardia sp. NPDC049635]|uniref:glucuronyl esterase domain-containing protein n=1 Tax=Pseudonocardia sp. NPDC049635 TaxID=3155506 RepID=UPI0033D393BC
MHIPSRRSDRSRRSRGAVRGAPAVVLAAVLFTAGGVAVPQVAAASDGQAGAASEPAGELAEGLTGVLADATITLGGADYPNPLRLQDGMAVDGPESWEYVRREELLADFREHVYGQSLPFPAEQTFDVSTSDTGDVVRKTVTIGVTGPEGSGSFDLRLFVPQTDGQPRGTFLMIDHRGSVGDDPGRSSSYAPVSTITDAGYAFAVIDANDLAPDDSGSYRDGVIDLFHPSGQDLPDDAGRAISAWAWGASRAMDYLETDPDIDPSTVGVIGHSRSGKASLWAGAQDTRFAAVITNNSGSTGAKLARRGDGGVGAETVARINSSFPHWFPQTYREYNDNESALPVDQHELMALVAPRRLVVGSATDDANADPEGEFLAYVGAARAYELYGLGDTGLSSAAWRPETDRAFRGPAMSYHLRSGGHGLTGADWDHYLEGDLFSRGTGATGL